MPLRNRWTMAILTSAGIFVTFVLRVNLSPVAPLLQRDLHLSDFELGLYHHDESGTRLRPMVNIHHINGLPCTQLSDPHRRDSRIVANP